MRQVIHFGAKNLVGTGRHRMALFCAGRVFWACDWPCDGRSVHLGGSVFSELPEKTPDFAERLTRWKGAGKRGRRRAERLEDRKVRIAENQRLR